MFQIKLFKRAKFIHQQQIDPNFILINIPKTKFIGPIWSLDLSLNNYFGLYIFLDIYLWAIFVFSWAHFTILLTEHKFVMRRGLNFMKKNVAHEGCKLSIKLAIALFGYILFPHFYLVLFLLSCKYSFLYISWVYTKLNNW